VTTRVTTSGRRGRQAVSSGAVTTEGARVADWDPSSLISGWRGKVALILLALVLAAAGATVSNGHGAVAIVALVVEVALIGFFAWFGWALFRRSQRSAQDRYNQR
jgi:hypothetical protein